MGSEKLDLGCGFAAGGSQLSPGHLIALQVPALNTDHKTGLVRAPKIAPKRQKEAPNFWISFFHLGFFRGQLAQQAEDHSGGAGRVEAGVSWATFQGEQGHRGGGMSCRAVARSKRPPARCGLPLEAGQLDDRCTKREAGAKGTQANSSKRSLLVSSYRSQRERNRAG
jgi:hypothetical protein